MPRNFKGQHITQNNNNEAFGTKNQFETMDQEERYPKYLNV